MILKGISVSPGIVIGTVYVYQSLNFEVPESYFEAGLEEQFLQKFETSRKIAQKELTKLSEEMNQKDTSKAKIFMAHKMLLNDQELIESIYRAIKKEKKCTDYAISSVIDGYIAILNGVKDQLIAARSADLRDIKNRLLRIIYGQEEKNLSSLHDNVIVVAHELLPSDAATLDRAHCLGIITEAGSTTSHAAIIARSFQIPAILSVPKAMDLLQEGDNVILDSTSGEIIVNPDEITLNKYQDRMKSYKLQLKHLKKYSCLPALTKDGQKIELGINIGMKHERTTDFFDFIGLYRTELLFMEQEHIPTEEEQLQEYKRILERYPGKSVTLRTLDVGGDKKIPYMNLIKEENPALGKRGLRLCLEQTDLFLTQIRAALRASVYGQLQIMFPMVGSMDDIRKAKEIVTTAKEQLRKENVAFDEKIQVGIMIEVPSIAIIADHVAREVDFASIGTNDLTQYLCAADRTNSEVSMYYQEFSPALLRTIGFVFEQFNRLGKSISVCGELASNPTAAVLLVGLGARKLSMNKENLSDVKAVLLNVTIDKARNMAEACKNYCTEEEIHNFLSEFIN